MQDAIYKTCGVRLSEVWRPNIVGINVLKLYLPPSKKKSLHSLANLSRETLYTNYYERLHLRFWEIHTHDMQRNHVLAVSALLYIYVCVYVCLQRTATQLPWNLS